MVTRVPPPARVTLPLEASAGHIVLVAETFEDELRLRIWLRASGAFRSLPVTLERLLDDLDQHDVDSEDAA